MKTYHDSDVRWFWREHAMFNDAAKRITKALNRRQKRRELKQRDKDARYA